MLGGLFKKKKAPEPPVNQPAEPYHLRPMEEEDLPRVIEIIAETDEDDAEEAEENLNARQGQGMYVLEGKGHIIGLTGFYLASDIPGIGWLSWTYLDPSHQGQGAGKFMVNRLLDIIDGENVRKLFIASSDYEEDGEPVYAAAHAFYQSMGAEKELQLDDYHDQGEAMIFFGLVNKRFDLQPREQIPATGVRFSGINPAAESADGYELEWESSPAMQEVDGLEDCLAQAREKRARFLMVALPEDISDLASATLDAAGFRLRGKLQDYYDKGVDQVYWSMKNL
jgi:GNAT superfamily N-acetyltransferase